MVALAIALGAVTLGCGIAIVTAVAFGERSRRKRLNAAREKTRHYRRFVEDRANVNHQACSCCGGYATKLRPDAMPGVFLCEDRELCRTSMIYQNMLESTG